MMQFVGRELCFWCVETFRKCHLHDNSSVFWNDVTVRSHFDDDVFRIVDERDLVNVDNRLQLRDDKFYLPPTSSSSSVSGIFHFEKCENPVVFEETPVKVKKTPEKTKEKKSPVEKRKSDRQKKYYSKVHKNALKTITPAYTRGKKCDQSQKLFVCDICEISCTLRHNLQTHLVLYHGETANVTEESVARLKIICSRKIEKEC